MSYTFMKQFNLLKLIPNSSQVIELNLFSNNCINAFKNLNLQFRKTKNAIIKVSHLCLYHCIGYYWLWMPPPHIKIFTKLIKNNSRSFIVSIPCDTQWETWMLQLVFFLVLIITTNPDCSTDFWLISKIKPYGIAVFAEFMQVEPMKAKGQWVKFKNDGW